MADNTPQVPPIHPPSVTTPVALHVADKISDITGILTIGYLALHHIVDGMLALLAIGALLGVNTGLRQLGKRSVGAGLGVVGLGLVSVLHHPLLFRAATTASAAAVEAARSSHG